MNFKLKALVAAVAFAAAGSAFAAINTPTGGASQSGDVFFYEFGTDAAGKVSTYVKDLGVSYSDFMANPGYAATNLSGDANFTAFNNAALVGDKYWGVAAIGTGAGASSAVEGYFKLATTATANDISVSTGWSDNVPLINAWGNIQNVGGLVTSTSAFYGAATDAGYALQSANLGAYLGSDFASSGAFFSATNVVGTTTTSSFFNVERGAGFNVDDNPSTVAQVKGEWNFSGSNLSYTVAAVPEPETYAMLAAGLLVLGAVARRRRAV